ncbi:unnamed protein product [Tuber melanosporum]|uniref:(Perigord truffle) hypothetical protein n=1 Tax=Tuber melanosporum (strain Mel28) TaxID=656061 RepID=D5GF20_TUBMM|nr:uncharacterized protein GSTUM_00006706001 [Tuber melanosporum]CAZ83113.1 unnamed protein product [Tuber melanosporum]
MELSRSEYPGIVGSVHPTPAVKILRDRLHRVQVLNTEIADWLQERRRVEELYAQGLNKLAKRTLSGDRSDLGVFQGPWTRIVQSTHSVASSHQEFAQKIDAEVERPLRDFTVRNQEWAGMKNLETNMAAVAKAVDSAEEKVEKLKKRGPKAKAHQVAEAASAASNALAEWDSQAPFVFEKFQAADESRVNQLRDVLTTWQTLEVDQSQRSMQSAESTLNIILDISTEDEIRGFANKATVGKQRIERERSRTASSGATTVSGGGGLGLKRIGTVFRARNRNSSIPYFHRSASPGKRSSERLGGGKVHPPLPSSPHPTNNGFGPSRGENSSLAVPLGGSPPRPSTARSIPPSPTQNGDAHPPASPTASAAGPSQTLPTPSVLVTSEEPRRDAEGYTIPPPVHDIGGSALPDDETADEPSQPQFKVEIKNDVIQEEEEEADAALSKVATTLRAQNTVSRRNRGRRDARDVRNTMFIPNPAPEPVEGLPSSPPLTPIKFTPKSSAVASEAGSDTLSIRSSRSVTSLASSPIRHPELTETGLSASLIESVSMSFEAGAPTKTLITGEIAVAYNPIEPVSLDQSFPAELVRMDNFSVLEKVAPNPAFISSVPDRAGEYTMSLANIHKTSVAFKYQVHIDEANVAVFAPIIATPIWRLEPHQSSVIIHWKPNPGFRRLSGATGTFTMKNVIFTAGIEGTPATTCQSKPAGTFSRERGRLVWKLGDVLIDPAAGDEGAKKLVARFQTEGQARATPVDMRWEISGEDANTAGSGLTLSSFEKPEKPETAAAAEAEEVDPFADEGGEAKSVAGADEEGVWKAVNTIRKVMGGKYVAV